jgi:hypothetical protein
VDRYFETGHSVRASCYEFDILSELEVIQSRGGDVISQTVEVYERYGVSRFFRRGSNMHAINQGVSEAGIDHSNYWSIGERAKGSIPGRGNTAAL